MKMEMIQEQTTYFKMKENEAYRVMTRLVDGKTESYLYYCGALNFDVWKFVYGGCSSEAFPFTHETFCELVSNQLMTGQLDENRDDWIEALKDIAEEAAYEDK